MAIGNTVNLSIPVVGTTVDSVAKARDGLYIGDFTVGGETFTSSLTLRPAAAQGARKRFGATYKLWPAVPAGPATASKGSVTVSVNIDSEIGSQLTGGELASQVRYALAAMLSSTLVETLRDGSLQ